MGVSSESRTAFQSLVDLLGEISRDWIGPTRGVEDPEHDALAHESLAAVLSGALEFYLTEDFEKPVLTPIVSTRRKWSDNPDARYFFAPIEGDATYRIRGRRGSEVYLSFSVHRGDRDGHWPQGVSSDLNMRDMRFEPDGRYEVVLSATRAEGNWIPLEPDAGSVVVRFYYQNERTAADDPTTAPVISIERERERGSARPTPAVDDAEVARRLARVANWVRSKYGRQVLPPKGGARPTWFASQPNTLGSPEVWESGKSGGGWGAVDVAYSAGSYQLEPNQALVMEGQLPRGVFSNVVLWNAIGRTEDYRDRQVSRNARQLELDSERRFRIVVAHADPGIRDWLDTAGRRSGTIYWRHMLPAEPVTAPQCRVVPFAEVCRK